MKTIWNKKTGEPREYEAVDAREILTNSPDLYTDVDPNAKKSTKGMDPDGDGREGHPQNVANVENEFRREAVGDDPPPAEERTETIIRNPVTDRPRMADSAGEGVRSTPDFDAMSVSDLKAYADERRINLDGATKKADILEKVKPAK